MKYDAIIIGGGAAGLFCAITAARRGRKTLVVEHNAETGRKIIISGGGRCNFTNIHTQPENFISRNPHFCKSALAGFTPQDFLKLVRRHKIEYYEKKLGQLFCRGRSAAIRDMLLTECGAARVDIRTGCTVRRVTKDGDFHVDTTQGVFSGSSVVVACGGLSFPKIGASDMGYRIARQFGLKIVETRPSLVAMVFEGNKKFGSLAGISIDSLVSADGQRFRENILFTHRGLSGPAIIQISNYWQRNEDISISLIPEIDIKAVAEADPDRPTRLGKFLGKFLPARFVSEFFPAHQLNKTLAQLDKKELDAISDKLCDWRVRFAATEGFDRAEVTLGGISTDELSSKTMEARKVSGLYFIGEVVDVTGWLGGYNFQWAWASGFAAGNAV